ANARLLSSKCGMEVPPRDLVTVPIVKADAEQLKSCAPVFEADETLRELYGRFWENQDKDAAIWRADTLLTSVGVSKMPPEQNLNIPDDKSYDNFTSYEVLGYFDGKPERGNFIGDIAGVLFNDLGQAVTLKDRQLVGPRLEHITHIAKTHREALKLDFRHSAGCGKGAGVLVITRNPLKAEALYHLLTNGFINEIVTDEPTALAILDQAKKRRPSSSAKSRR
ncbi:MAG: hypothetical protein HQK55_04185, partial [Deltaproteobacteria bacterium]|nr:hypothetical protein [Deltaproteobacteria bacterium]